MDEDAEEAKDDQNNQTDKQHSIAGSEVVFGLWEYREHTLVFMQLSHQTQFKEVADTNLHGEYDHCEAHNSCDAHCHDHRLSVVETCYHSHHVGHA